TLAIPAGEQRTGARPYVAQRPPVRGAWRGALPRGDAVVMADADERAGAHVDAVGCMHKLLFAIEARHPEGVEQRQALAHVFHRANPRARVQSHVHDAASWRCNVRAAADFDPMPAPLSFWNCEGHRTRASTPSRFRKNYRDGLQLLLRVCDAIGLHRRGREDEYSRAFDRVV